MNNSSQAKGQSKVTRQFLLSLADICLVTDNTVSSQPRVSKGKTTILGLQRQVPESLGVQGFRV